MTMSEWSHTQLTRLQLAGKKLQNMYDKKMT